MGKFRNRNIFSYCKNIYRLPEVMKAQAVTSQWWDLTLAYLGFKKLSYPYEFNTRRGQKITLHTLHDLITVWVIFFRNEYALPKNSRVVVDVGANIGVFSIYAHSAGARKVYAVEPFPPTFSELSKNITLNNLQRQVTTYPVALAKQSGEVEMDASAGPSQSRGLAVAGGADTIGVKSLTLDDFFGQISENEIDFMKMDIEGGEYDVLLSAADHNLRKIKNFALEYHPNGSKDLLFQRLHKARFRLQHDFKISDKSGVAHFTRI